MVFLMLVGEGKVKLDDPIARDLPAFQELWLAAERDNEQVLLRPSRHSTDTPSA